jgi:hypothetical protein
MAVQLKQATTVIESLRASRRADDATSRLHSGSLEEALGVVKKLVESTNWKHGPATLVSTFPHHAVARTPDGNLVRVEWTSGKNGVALGRATVFESATPAPDIGDELFHTAAAAVDRIMSEDYESLDPMISSMTEALETSGDLQRRLSTEITLRAIKRDAWWHNVVREHYEGNLVLAAQPRSQGPDVLRESFDDLLKQLRESAVSVSASLRAIDKMPADPGVSSIATDIASDITNAVSAMMNVESDNPQETATVYESVMSVSDYLLTGAKFLTQIAASNLTDRE